MADDQGNQNDAADERQTQPRRGIPGRGSDAAQSPDGANVARDTDGRGSENQRDDVPSDPNVEAVTQAFDGAATNASGISRDGPDAIDLEDMSGATRREPGH